MSHGDAQVAQALADGFLGDGWELPALIERGAQVLGARRRWLGPLARVVLAAYRDAPLDRHRELAAFVATAPPFQRAAQQARERGRPLRAVRLLPTATEMGRARWPVVPLGDLADLAGLLAVDQAHLAWLADTGRRQRRAPPGPLHLYRHRWLPRPGRVPRLLEVPLPRLRRAQRVLLDQVAGPIPAHAAAHGFVPGRSAVSGARPHVGAAVVATLDLSAFFATVSAGRVYGTLRSAGYPEPVAHALTGLCTTATPVAVIAAMPPGGSPEQRSWLRGHLARPHLPQGAPTSPHLANLAAHRLDVRLSGYAAAVEACYTRYADDLTFSGDDRLRRRVDALIAGVGRIVAAEGFTVHPSKTRVRYRGDRQLVTGIVVNDRPNVGRAECERLEATLHNAVRTGPHAQNRDGLADFRAHLTGRVAWVHQLNPERGRRLRAVLDRIDWQPIA